MAVIIKRAPWECPTSSAWANRSTLQLTIFASALLLAVLLAGCQTSTPQQQFEYGGTPSTAASGYPGDSECAMWRAVLEDRHGNTALLHSASEIASRCGMPYGGSDSASSEPLPASFTAPQESPQAQNQGHCPPTVEDLMQNRYCNTPPPMPELDAYQRCILIATHFGISGTFIPAFCGRYRDGITPFSMQDITPLQRCIVLASHMGVNGENIPEFCARYRDENR